ncbi:MAG: DUF3306 domain-containing protein [Rhodospirillaceae bacterium]|nr:DUF3306 domain-containing protein [Rhodospirillaceae bacterium]
MSRSRSIASRWSATGGGAAMAERRSFVDRWSERKQTARRGGAAPAFPEEEPRKREVPFLPPLADEEGAGTVPATLSQEQVVASEPEIDEDDEGDPEVVASLPDIETLQYESDFTVFLQQGVPERLRRLALRRLWSSNAVLANLDGLIDYGDDFTDAATVIEGMQTVYQVGKGMPGPEPEEDEEKDDLEEEDAQPDAKIAAAPEKEPDDEPVASSNDGEDMAADEAGDGVADEVADLDIDDEDDAVG